MLRGRPKPEPKVRQSDLGADHPSLSSSAQVPPKRGQSLRLVSLNLAHGRRVSAHQAFLKRATAEKNVGQVARLLRQLAPDVVALQEADGPSAWSGNFDHVATLADRADLEDHFRGNHNPFGSERYPLASGTALVSGMKLQDQLSERFATNWRDTKGFVVAALQVPQWNGLAIDVVSVHLDFLRPAIRRRQILRLVHALIHRRRPLVVMGDLNCCWQRESSTLELFREHLDLHAYLPHEPAPTFPSSNPKRRLDWVLASKDLTFGDYHTLRSPLSDHLAIVADVHPA